MASNEMQQARVTGITYRSEDYRNVIVLCGDKAIYEISDGMGWSAESTCDIETAWVIIAHKNLKLVA